MKKYIELTEYDNNGRTVIFADSIQGLCRVRDGSYDKEFTELIVSGYPLLVNEPIDEILEKMESDQGHLDGIDVLDKIRAEIESLQNANPSYWHSGDMVERDEVFEIIDKYKAESEAQE